MRDISHNLEVTNPLFRYFINNMNEELSRWVQYDGVEVIGSGIFFKFKSSEVSLRFSVYAGVNTPNTYELLKGRTNEISDYFRALKNETVK